MVVPEFLFCSMLRPVDQWFLSQPEPLRGCLMQLRQLILNHSPKVEERLSYGMPFYYFGKKRLVYLWFHKKLRLPYLGFTDGKLIDSPDLLQEDRSRMKIMLIDPGKEIPVERIIKLIDYALTIKQRTKKPDTQ